MEENIIDTNFVEVNNVKITIPCDKLLQALSKMQGVLENAKKESENPYFKSKYADLATCLQALKKPMAENGLSVSQHCSFDGANVQCITVLGHLSGQMMISTLSMPVQKKDPQGVGAAITYARRYGLSAIVGLAQADDDAESAVYHDDESKEHRYGYASDKQVGLIKSLVSQGNIVMQNILDRYQVANVESLSMEQASNCIAILERQLSKRKEEEK